MRPPTTPRHSGGEPACQSGSPAGVGPARTWRDERRAHRPSASSPPEGTACRRRWVLAYTLRVGLSGRLFRSPNLFNSPGLLAMTAVLRWQVVESLRQPQAVPGIIPFAPG